MSTLLRGDGGENPLGNPAPALTDSADPIDSPAWIDLDDLGSGCDGHAVMGEATKNPVTGALTMAASIAAIACPADTAPPFARSS